MNEQGTPPPPVGTPLPDWTPRPWPPGTSMKGRFVTVELLDPDLHADDLFEAASEDRNGRNWAYMPYGPFADRAAHRSWVEDMYAGKDPFLHAVIDNATGKAVGTLSFMRIQPEIGVIEIGHIVFSPRIQRTPGATETIWLMLTRAFDELGYRRCEWKCDSLNAPSRAAARRFGFRFEGIFRQAKSRSMGCATGSGGNSGKTIIRWTTPPNHPPSGPPPWSPNSAKKPRRSARRGRNAARLRASQFSSISMRRRSP